MLVTFVLFMVLVPILLLNMLIAMMGNTYATVVQQSEKEWVKQVRRLLQNLTPSTMVMFPGLYGSKCRSRTKSVQAMKMIRYY